MVLLAFTYAIIVGIFTLYYAVMVLYYMLGWQTISLFKASGAEPKTKLCVVVAARNEQENIIKLLQCFKNQDYPKELYEVIIIDDHSDDLTPELVENFEMDNLHLLHLKDYVDDTVIAFKKRALELAVKNTIAEVIVTTDADCEMGTRWLSNIAAFYEETDSQFIVAPVDYHELDSTIKKLQELDFLSMMAVTGASVKHGLHNLSNGANMAYTREAFMNVNGYEENDVTPSGDDVFLIEKIGQKYPDKVNYLKNRDAIVYTKACDTFKQLFQQRMRWISKTKHYTKWTTKLIALGFLGFYVFLFANLVGSFFNTFFLTLFITQVLLKALVDFAILDEVSSFFKRRNLLKFYPIVETLHFPFTLAVTIASQFFPYRWKNRKVNQ